MRRQQQFNDFDEWATSPPPAQHEPMKNRLRRIEPITVTWRGEVHRFGPEAPLMFGSSTAVVSRVSLWPPTSGDPDHPWPRHCWTADVLVLGFGFVAGKGDTPQAALDALSAELPSTLSTMVRGGSC